ncbi:MAG: hypothetical protein ACPGU1_04035 [Myxococcota bacterium]
MNARFTSLVIALSALSACAEPVAQCVDESCPIGEACAAGVCAPVAPPSTTGALGRYTSVAHHPDGALLIATYDATYRNLVLLRRELDGTERRRVIDGWSVIDHTLQDRDRGQWSAIVVSPEGDAHLAWYDADGGNLRYGTLAGADLDAAIAIEIVDGEGAEDRGRHASIGVASDGVVHLAYRDETSRSLRYARRHAPGEWALEEVPVCTDDPECEAEVEDYGEFAELVLIGGAPRVAFYDRARGDLKLAQRDATGQWSVATLDGHDAERDVDTGDVGRFVSAAVDAKQRLGIAYYDVTRGALRYIFASGATPAPVVVDDGVYVDSKTGATRQHLVGQHAELVFDLRDGAVILYLDAGQLAVKRARLVGDQVVGRSVMTGLRPGGYISAVMDSAGRLSGAYGAWPLDAPGGSELVVLGEEGGAL